MALISSKQIQQPVEFTGSYTGSFFGTFTGTVNGGGGGGGGGGYYIGSGSITASVGQSNNIFLITSSSTEYTSITPTTTTISNDIFIISNKNNIATFKISQSIVYFATQSQLPINPTTVGGIYFTSSSIYVGLE
jgi:hypothetical protein